MSKIQVTLDAVKLRKLVSQRTFENKNGESVTVQEVKFDLVEVKEPKEVYKNDKLRLVKTHFAAAQQTKEEREAKKDTFFIGDGVTILFDNDNTNSEKNKQAPTPNNQP